MPYTNAWNVTDPAGTVSAKNIDDEIRKLRLQLQERLTGNIFTDMSLDPLVLTDDLIGKADNLQIIVPFSDFVSTTDEQRVTYNSGGWVQISGGSVAVAKVSGLVPVGCTITKLEWLGEGGALGGSYVFSSRPFADAAFDAGDFTDIDTIVLAAGAAFGIHAGADLTQVVANDTIYYLKVIVNNFPGTSIKLAGVRITFNRPSIASAT